MAKNRARHLGRKLNLSVAAVNGSGAGDLVKSGDPGAVGQIPFVALTDEDAAGFASIDTYGVYNLVVAGRGIGVDAAVAVGDILYWDNADGQVNKDSTNGVRFGYALGAVVSGVLTTTIEVRLGY